ncbi:MAG: hypothetical protein Q7K26_05635 [bacterium]|nr:hypothetical protein [bacterium]
MNIRLLIVSIILLPITVQAEKLQNSSLCGAEENVVFSCSAKHKIVSLCATKELTAKYGQLIYRYGQYNQTPELTYANELNLPGKVFSTYFENWSKGGYAAVTFSRGEFAYTIYNRRAVYEIDNRSNGGGIKIYRKEELISDLWCEGASIEDNIWRNLRDKEFPETAIPVLYIPKS